MTYSEIPEQLVAELLLLLDMEPRGLDRFEGRRRKSGEGRVYGGQVIAQALAAAEHTVEDDRSAHSLHCYFLRGGSETHTIDYRILRDFDGGSVSNRRVTACQQGEVILNMTASFQKRLNGFAQQAIAMPDVPAPEDLGEDLARRKELAETQGIELNERLLEAGPIDWRTVELAERFSNQSNPPVHHSWFRTKARLPDDPRVHRAVLAYASDMVMLGTASMPFPACLGTPSLVGSTIDHSIWFHEEFRADEWLMFRSESPWAGHSRAFTRAGIFTRDGRLVASVTQEGMLRQLDTGS